jgi:hypothetical protein
MWSARPAQPYHAGSIAQRALRHRTVPLLQSPGSAVRRYEPSRSGLGPDPGHAQRRRPGAGAGLEVEYTTAALSRPELDDVTGVQPRDG